MNQSDLIIEVGEEIQLPSKNYTQKGVKIHECTIDNVLSRKTGRKQGEYVTISPDIDNSPETVSSVLKNTLKKLLRLVGVHEGKLLIVGLGNENVIVDALGNEVVKRIMTGGKDYSLATIAPKVADITGIKSFDIVKAIVQETSPSVVIAIDTLATKFLYRLGNCYQLTTSGICPGSGVNNPQPCLDKQNLAVPVIAIGVPLIISVGSIIGNDKKAIGYSHYMLTPRDVDSLVVNCARIIADAINSINR